MHPKNTKNLFAKKFSSKEFISNYKITEFVTRQESRQKLGRNQQSRQKIKLHLKTFLAVKLITSVVETSF